MDLVNEKHVALVEVGEKRGKISLFFNGRARCHSKVDSHLCGDDARQGGFTQAGRAVEQDMIQRVTAHSGGLDIYLQVLFRLVLADIFLHPTGAQGGFGILIPRRVAG